MQPLRAKQIIPFERFFAILGKPYNSPAFVDLANALQEQPQCQSGLKGGMTFDFPNSGIFVFGELDKFAAIVFFLNTEDVRDGKIARYSHGFPASITELDSLPEIETKLSAKVSIRGTFDYSGCELSFAHNGSDGSMEFFAIRRDPYEIS